jgi:hypothetical protein
VPTQPLAVTCPALLLRLAAPSAAAAADADAPRAEGAGARQGCRVAGAVLALPGLGAALAEEWAARVRSVVASGEAGVPPGAFKGGAKGGKKRGGKGAGGAERPSKSAGQAGRGAGQAGRGAGRAPPANMFAALMVDVDCD